jgi:hypothetical protein
MSKRKTTEQFIEEARLVHNDKYDYSKVEYKNANDKVCIVCPVHGEFLQRPCDHTNGHGCKKCADDETSKRCRTKFNDFFKKATEVHNGKYEYDESSFSSASSKVRIKCPNHGWFEQLAIDHTRGIGCPDCGYDSHKHQIYGIAYNSSSKHLSHDSIYKCWRNLLERTIGKNKPPTYRDCTICEEWLDFERFRLWVNSCDSGYMDGYQLDKDILSNGNKHYSPDTCVFIPHDINSLFRKTSRNVDLPRGVNKYNSRYVAEFRTKGIHKKKYFSSKEEASKWYLKQKQQYIITLANDYYSKKLIHKRAYDGMLKYAVEKLI